MKELKRGIGLIILLMLLSLTLNAINLRAEDKRIIKEKSFVVNPGEKLFIEASGANINVDTWEKNEVKIQIHGSKKAESKMFVQIEKREGDIHVVTKKRDFSFFSFWGSLNVKIEVVLPGKFDTKIEASGGDVVLNDLNGEQNLHLSGGDIKLKNVSGNIIVETSGGEIDLSDCSGTLNLSSTGGNIDCKFISGNLKAFTSGGNIIVKSKNVNVVAKTTGGDIKIYLANDFKGIDAEATGGDILVELPHNSKANIEAETHGGEIECDISNIKTKKATKSKLIADLNGGGEKLIEKTSGGGILIKER